MGIDINKILEEAEKRSKVNNVVADVEQGVDSTTDDQGIGQPVDIITFTESGAFLSDITLFPWQRIILKAFYMKTIGNHNISFNNEEWEVMRNDLDEDNYEAIKEKMSDIESLPSRQQLVLCLGRRSFKSFLTSIIASYEAYKLLCDDCPQKQYGIPLLKAISIINVATSAPQAKIVFAEIESKIKGCEFLESRVGNWTADAIQFLTDADVRSNSNLSKNVKKTEGSVTVVSGHSNSGGLRGHAIIVVIYDEIAHFVDTSGRASDKGIYDALQPSLATFVRTDDDGNRFQDGKSILISSPTTKNRLFYHRYERALKAGTDSIGFRLPTWKANPNIYQADLSDEYESDPDMFMQEYAAEFSYGGTEAFFMPTDIDECVDRGMMRDLQNKTRGESGVDYFMHVDPARTSDNFALVIVHAEQVVLDNGDKEKRIVLDHAKAWIPIPENNIAAKNYINTLKSEDQYGILETVDGSIDPTIVEDYIIDISSKFNLTSISFDQWESASSIRKLQQKKFTVETLSFAGSNKSKYYGVLYKLVVGGLLDIFPSPLVSDELKFLQKKRNSAGWTVGRLDKDQKDDIADSLAGAAYTAYNAGLKHKRLPRSMTVHTGFR